MSPRREPAPPRRAGDALFHEALDRRRLTVLFQPLVDLRTGRVVGHEALSRGPAGTRLENPGVLFAAARAAGRTAELDWACRCTAFSDALHSARCPSWRLFVNAEPETLGSACPVDLVPHWRRAHRSLRVVVELTERSLLRRPAQLLQVVATLRELGWEVALDDVGANSDGVALLPVVEPDVVKLDASLLGEHLDAGQRATLRAVEAWTGRARSTVVAEGIETARHLRRAVELGATWGQGFLLGRPSPLPPLPPDAAAPARPPRCA
ncbi:MAG: EAL domain-containing protein, partial [Actinomycetota bacterium]|nr:EAL domain-containing protein [Actinomycetota bacterium]